MERLHAPNEFLRIRRLREGMRAWEELWRLLADGPQRPASQPNPWKELSQLAPAGEQIA
jgi:hypothetical protein